MKNRFKDPWFYITIVGLFLTTTQIDAETLTSWPILISKLEAVFMNPFLLFTFVLALIGQFRNPTTKGLKD